MSKFPPSVPLARLYERTSRRGSHYLTGRLGLSRITVLKTSEIDADDNPVWVLLCAEAPSSAPGAGGSRAGNDADATAAQLEATGGDEAAET